MLPILLEGSGNSRVKQDCNLVSDPHIEQESSVREVFMHALAAFNAADTDQSGELDWQELRVLITHMAGSSQLTNKDDEWWQKLFNKYDTDGSGTCCFDEFCAVFNELRAEGAPALQYKH